MIGNEISFRTYVLICINNSLYIIDMPTNSDFDGYFHGIGKIPLFTYGMIGVTTIVLGYMTYLDAGNPEEADETSGQETGPPIQSMIPEGPADLSFPTNDFSNSENASSGNPFGPQEGPQEGPQGGPQEGPQGGPQEGPQGGPQEGPQGPLGMDQQPEGFDSSQMENEYMSPPDFSENPERRGGKPKSKRNTKRRKPKSI
jgi:hypothetical protein